jgi:D-alanyl-D-alanine carboxypeptidase (penicillin-binding protein 5/6)
MRLGKRLAIAVLAALAALAAGAVSAGCSAAPGLAYAAGAAHPSADRSASTAPDGTGPTVAATPVSGTPAGTVLTVAGAPKGVKARAGLLVDVTTGQVLWAQEARAVRPIASITKVMTALVILRAGGLDREIVVPKAVTAYVAKNDADAAGLVPGQVLTVDQLLHAMLITSAADAAYTLAAAYGPGLPAFIGKMNAEAAKLGLTHTHFTSPDGLPYPSETSTYSTATELIRLGEIAMSYAEFRSIVRLRYYNIPRGPGHKAYSFTNSNELIGRYRGVIGIKTGFTDAAGHTLIFEAVRGDRALIGVVLGSPPTGPGAGAVDAAKVLDWGFALRQAG